jgi:putative membrane protein
MKRMRSAFASVGVVALVVGAAGCEPDLPSPVAPTQPTASSAVPLGAAMAQAKPSGSSRPGTPSSAAELPSVAPPAAAGTADAIGSSPPGGGQTSSGGPSETQLAGLDDPQLVAIVAEMNDEATRLAQFAESNAVNRDVKSFAHDMVTSRLDMQDKDGALLAHLHLGAAVSPSSDRLATEFRAAMTQLGSSRGTGFDRAYLNEELREESRELELVDRIIPHLRHPELAEAFTERRVRIEAHLHMARLLLQAPTTIPR